MHRVSQRRCTKEGTELSCEKLLQLKRMGCPTWQPTARRHCHMVTPVHDDAVNGTALGPTALPPWHPRAWWRCKWQWKNNAHNSIKRHLTFNSLHTWKNLDERPWTKEPLGLELFYWTNSLCTYDKSIRHKYGTSIDPRSQGAHWVPIRVSDNGTLLCILVQATETFFW